MCWPESQDRRPLCNLWKCHLGIWPKEPRWGRAACRCQQCGRLSSLPLIDNLVSSDELRAPSAPVTHYFTATWVKGLCVGCNWWLLIAPAVSVLPPLCPWNLCEMTPAIQVPSKPPELSITWLDYVRQTSGCHRQAFDSIGSPKWCTAPAYIHRKDSFSFVVLLLGHTVTYNFSVRV